jgi:glycine/sarcosine N-methyltransferase
LIVSQDAVLQFYNQFSDTYHLMFADWRKSVVRQGKAVSNLIRAVLPNAQTVLDCTAGIGTQALGIAADGFTVHATDISPEQIRRLREEADHFGVTLTSGVADIRKLDEQVEGQFDVVLSMDNSWAHLNTQEDLEQAARGMASKVRPGGIVIVSIRDYDEHRESKPHFVDPTVYDSPEGRRIIFQIWDWEDDGYTMNMYIVSGHDGSWETTHMTTWMHAVRREDVTMALVQAGLESIRWYSSSESKFYQPVVVAHLPGGQDKGERRYEHER